MTPGTPTLTVDLSGNCDSIPLTWDFSAKLPTNDVVLGTPVPNIQSVPAAPAAVFSNIQVASPIITAQVTITPPASAPLVYSTSCTVKTQQNFQLVLTQIFVTSTEIAPASASTPLTTYTTPLAVQALLGPQNYDGSTDLNQFVVSAHSLCQGINTYASLKKIQPLMAGDLEIVERWLAAHLYCQNNPALSSLSTGGISQGFQGQSTLNLNNTRWGQMAIMLDTTGYLNSINNRATASLTWLGSGCKGGAGTGGLTGGFGTITGQPGGPTGGYGSLP